MHAGHNSVMWLWAFPFGSWIRRHHWIFINTTKYQYLIYLYWCAHTEKSEPQFVEQLLFSWFLLILKDSRFLHSLVLLLWSFEPALFYRGYSKVYEGYILLILVDSPLPTGERNVTGTQTKPVHVRELHFSLPESNTFHIYRYLLLFLLKREHNVQILWSLCEA